MGSFDLQIRGCQVVYALIRYRGLKVVTYAGSHRPYAAKLGRSAQYVVF